MRARVHHTPRRRGDVAACGAQRVAFGPRADRTDHVVPLVMQKGRQLLASAGERDPIIRVSGVQAAGPKADRTRIARKVATGYYLGSKGYYLSFEDNVWPAWPRASSGRNYWRVSYVDDAEVNGVLG